MYRLSLAIFRGIITTTQIFCLAITFQKMGKIAVTCSSVKCKCTASMLHANQAETGGSIIELGARSSGGFTARTQTRYPLYRGWMGLGAGLVWS
jgi:hypothetical protein